MPAKIFRLDIRAGFKLGIHTDKYVNLIVNDMERKGMVDLSSRYPSLQGGEYNHGEFRYMVVGRVIRNINMKAIQQFTLFCYDLIKRISTSDTQMYDLDPSIAVVETVPLYRKEHTEEELQNLLMQADLKQQPHSEPNAEKP